MRLLLCILAVSAVAAASPTRARAQDYPWCALYDTGDAATNCGFVSREQCMATVSGIGGFCMPNNQYRPAKPGWSR
jgi:Protein of unknown function (DUF3551)